MNRLRVSPRQETRSRHPASKNKLTVTSPPGRRSVQFMILGLVAAFLTLLGVVMVLSASSVNDIRLHGDAWYHLKRQMIWLLLGTFSLVFMLRIDYRSLRRFALPLLLVTVLLLFLVLLPGVGVRTNGSARWLSVGPLTFQPSEIAKLAIVIYLADLLSRKSRKGSPKGLVLVHSLSVVGIIAILLMLEPDLGTTVILGILTFALLFFGGFKFRILASVGATGLVLAAAMSLSSGYRRQRLRGLLDPWTDPLNTGWQAIQSAIAVSNGGLLGVGLGASRAKWGFLPFAHTDFIYAIVAEEMGLIGALFVVIGYLIIGLVGVSVAVNAPDPFGQLLAAGVTTWILVQAFVNIGAVMGVLPITGVPLPFVSSGGSSLVLTMGAFGILLNVARQVHEK